MVPLKSGFKMPGPLHRIALESFLIDVWQDGSGHDFIGDACTRFQIERV
jgi:hypothetical protein